METMMLPVGLNPVELENKARQLADAIQARDVFELEAKERAKAAKDRLKELDQGVRKLARIVSRREEDRPVEVRLVPNTNRKTMEIVRLDTGEVAESRPMTPREKEDHCDQGRLFVDDRPVEEAS